MTGTVSDVSTSQLPKGWAWTNLDEIALAINPGFPSGKWQRAEGLCIPHLRPMNIDSRGSINLSEVKYVEYRNTEPLTKGDILFNNTNSPKLIGKTTYIKEDTNWAYSNHMTRIKVHSTINPGYISHYLHYLFVKGFFFSNCLHHVNQASVNTTFLKEKVPVPLAPTAEQGRIVTKIEELFSFLDAGAGSLLKVQAQLKRYRRAVLKYAFEEKLTEKLQKANKVPVELDDFVVSKGTSSKVLKEWVMAKMTDVCKVRGRVGWKGYTKGDLRTGGPKVIGATHLSEGLRIDMSDPVFISREKYLESPEIMVKMNDIIIAQRGSLGKVALVDYDLGEATINPCVLLLKDIKINSKFLLYLLASPRYQDFLMKGNTSTTTPMITQEFLKNLTIPVPTSSEQDSIVEEIERLLSVAEEVELSVKMSSKREVRLRQSILKTAFEGRLVSQDKNDEPAKKLLERIRETHGRKESLATNNNKQEDLSRYVK